jgi:prevent-host-death family protein
MRAVGVRELKAHTSRILRRLRETREGTPITHRGKVVAHLVAAEEYERLTSGRADFWDALVAFRGRTEPVDAADAFSGLRPRTKGRRFRW